MFCRRCGTQIPNDSKFCQVCGTEVITLKPNTEPTKPDVDNEHAYPFVDPQTVEIAGTTESVILAEDTNVDSDLVASDTCNVKTIIEISSNPRVTEVEELLETIGLKGVADHYGISDVIELRQLIHKYHIKLPHHEIALIRDIQRGKIQLE